MVGYFCLFSGPAINLQSSRLTDCKHTVFWKYTNFVFATIVKGCPLAIRMKNKDYKRDFTSTYLLHERLNEAALFKKSSSGTSK